MLKYFLPVCDLPFHCLREKPKVFLDKFLNFNTVQFINFFSFIDRDFVVISKNSLPNSGFRGGGTVNILDWIVLCCGGLSCAL